MRKTLGTLFVIFACSQFCHADDDLRAALNKAVHDLEAPLVDGFNDPNAIVYGPKRDAALKSFERLMDVIDPIHENWGAHAAVRVKTPDGFEKRGARFYRQTCLGQRFRAEDLVHYLERYASGELRIGNEGSRIRVLDTLSVLEIVGGAKVSSAAPVMLKLLKNQDTEACAESYRWLAAVGHDRDDVFNELSKTLGSGRFVFQIAPGMQYFGAKRAMPVLLKTLSLPGYASRELIQAIGNFEAEAKDAVAPLTKLLEDENHELRSAAVLALRRIGPAAEPAVPSLLKIAMGEALNECDIRDAMETIAAIGPSARDAMLKAAHDPETGRFGLALEALLEAKPYSEALPILIQGLSSPDPLVRIGAAKGLSRPEAKTSVPLLINRLSDTDPGVREAAAQALGAIGPAAKSAVPMLTAALKDPQDDVQSAATFALRSITRAEEPPPK